jgi:hypothetical protein
MGMKQGFLLGSLLGIAIVAANEWLPNQNAAPLLSPAQKQAVASRPITEQRREPISIAGVREPDEMLVEPLPINGEPAAPLRELAEATNNFSKGNFVEMLPALDRILTRYPDFADGYVFRVGALCETNDRRRAMSDLNSAIKFIGNSLTGKDSIRSLLSMRAKLAYADGDYVAQWMT